MKTRVILILIEELILANDSTYEFGQMVDRADIMETSISLAEERAKDISGNDSYYFHGYVDAANAYGTLSRCDVYAYIVDVRDEGDYMKSVLGTDDWLMSPYVDFD